MVLFDVVALNITNQVFIDFCLLLPVTSAFSIKLPTWPLITAHSKTTSGEINNYYNCIKVRRILVWFIGEKCGLCKIKIL